MKQEKNWNVAINKDATDEEVEEFIKGLELMMPKEVMLNIRKEIKRQRLGGK